MNLRVALMPSTYRNRPGYRLSPTSITIHNTANPDATAANHVTFLNKEPRSASWHICVDDIEAVLQVPLNEQAWHAGTSEGNKTSIGIEVCEFTDPKRQEAAFSNAQKLVAAMLGGSAPEAFRATHLGVEDIRTHQSWSGKYCPRLILPWWSEFVAGIAAHLGGSEDMKASVAVLKEAVGWQVFYLLVAPYLRDRIYTSNPDEVRALLEAGWTFGDEAFRVSLTDPTNTRDLHRFVLPNGRHFWTADEDEKASLMVTPNAAYEGAVIKVGTGGVQVRRLYKEPDHILTANAAEKPDGYRDEGAMFGCGTAPAPTDCADCNTRFEGVKDKVADLAKQILTAVQ